MFKNYEIVKFFMLYMFNRWSLSEARLVFGETLGNHIYGKYQDMRRNGQDSLMWFGEIDDGCKEKLVERAMDVYTRPQP